MYIGFYNLFNILCLKTSYYETQKIELSFSFQNYFVQYWIIYSQMTCSIIY